MQLESSQENSNVLLPFCTNGNKLSFIFKCLIQKKNTVIDMEYIFEAIWNLTCPTRTGNLSKVYPHRDIGSSNSNSMDIQPCRFVLPQDLKGSNLLSWLLYFRFPPTIFLIFLPFVNFHSWNSAVFRVPQTTYTNLHLLTLVTIGLKITAGGVEGLGGGGALQSTIPICCKSVKVFNWVALVSTACVYRGWVQDF